MLHIRQRRYIPTLGNRTSQQRSRTGLFTSHTSSANEDWACLVTSPDFEVMYRQTRSFESVPRRGMVTGPRRSGDVPVVDHPPPGSTRFVVSRVLQRLRPCSQRRTDRSGEQSQRREASADRFASLLLLLLLQRVAFMFAVKVLTGGSTRTALESLSNTMLLEVIRVSCQMASPSVKRL